MGPTIMSKLTTAAAVIVVLLAAPAAEMDPSTEHDNADRATGAGLDHRPPCPYCGGRGRIKSLTTICLNLRKELLHLRGRTGQAELLLRVHPEVARALQQEERAILDELQKSLGVHILVQSDPELHHERFNVVEV